MEVKLKQTEQEKSLKYNKFYLINSTNLQPCHSNTQLKWIITYFPVDPLHF